MKTRTDKIVEISGNSRDYLQALYLDYVNNFLSVQGFADCYGLTYREADNLIEIARMVHKGRTE